MKTVILAIGALLFLSESLAMDNTPPAADAPMPESGAEKSVSIPSSFGSSDIQNWRVIDDSHMVIETVRYGELLATFSMPCRGLKYAETIAFDTMGPFDLDKTTKVRLPDKTTCYIKELTPYTPPEKSPDAPAAE